MKQKITKRVAVVVGTTVIALGAAGYAVAQSGDSREDERKAFLNDAAQRLDKSPEELTKALQEAAIARIDAGVKDGRITEEQANEMKERIRQGDGLPFLGGPGGHGHHHRGGGPRAGLTAAAEYLGLSAAELREQLHDDRSLADVAGERNKSVDGLKDAMEKAIRADIEKAVENRRLTREQADRMLEDVRSRIDEKVERGGPSRGGPGGHRGPGGPGGPGGFGPPPGDGDGPPPPADGPPPPPPGDDG